MSTKVTLTNAGHSVEIESDSEDFTTVTAAAILLYRRTTSRVAHTPDGLGFSVTGGQIELAPEPYVSDEPPRRKEERL